MQGSRRTFPILLLFIGAGLIVLGIASYLLLPHPASQASISINTSTPLLAYPDSQYPRVQLKDALAAYSSKTAIFVDVRGKEAYDQQHIPGALSIPLSNLADQTFELPKNAWIITYCT